MSPPNFCSSCGHKFESGVAFCENCGSAVHSDAQAVALSTDRKIPHYAEASQGDAYAQERLGKLYEDGEGVPQDYERAVYWFLKAANQGYAEAQNSLGKRYELGEGVPQDFAHAVYWYRKAAEQGNAEAQFALRYQ